MLAEFLDAVCKLALILILTIASFQVIPAELVLQLVIIDGSAGSVLGHQGGIFGVVNTHKAGFPHGLLFLMVPHGLEHAVVLGFSKCDH